VKQINIPNASDTSLKIETNLEFDGSSSMSADDKETISTHLPMAGGGDEGDLFVQPSLFQIFNIFYMRQKLSLAQLKLRIVVVED